MDEAHWWILFAASAIGIGTGGGAVGLWKFVVKRRDDKEKQQALREKDVARGKHHQLQLIFDQYKELLLSEREEREKQRGRIDALGSESDVNKRKLQEVLTENMSLKMENVQLRLEIERLKGNGV